MRKESEVREDYALITHHYELEYVLVLWLQGIFPLKEDGPSLVVLLQQHI